MGGGDLPLLTVSPFALNATQVLMWSRLAAQSICAFDRMKSAPALRASLMCDGANSRVAVTLVGLSHAMELRSMEISP